MLEGVVLEAKKRVVLQIQSNHEEARAGANEDSSVVKGPTSSTQPSAHVYMPHATECEGSFSSLGPQRTPDTGAGPLLA